MNSKVLTRIYIEDDGTLVITDLWDEVGQLLAETGGYEIEED